MMAPESNNLGMVLRFWKCLNSKRNDSNSVEKLHPCPKALTTEMPEESVVDIEAYIDL